MPTGRHAGWIAWVAPLCLLLILCSTPPALAQPYGRPDQGEPGDAMIQAYLARVAAELSAGYDEDLVSREEWLKARPARYAEYLYMLGLDPLPEKTPLHAQVTGTLDRVDYLVDKLHFQSRPGLYVTANLYRPKPSPADADAGAGATPRRLPAVLYVCGHAGHGRNGNKVAYQSHGIWLARHGYVCLVLDTLQLGEIASVHHGTYNLERWWWHARGYTPAGVEAWNGIRGIDYLLDRPDVDPERLAVTGISGGGAATFWIAAADDRVRVAIPVSGMADLESYVTNRVINGHCDCMFLYNTFQWPWTRIAGLIAPRPMLFSNSDQDSIFPMDANERVINRLERLYSLYGASDVVDAMVSVGGHAYREDLRQASFRFLNTHLKGDPSPITDSEVDLVGDRSDSETFPIPPESLRVFPTDADLPADQRNTVIDTMFVPIAQPSLPSEATYKEWRSKQLDELRRVAWRYFPDRIPAATVVRSGAADRGFVWTMQSEPGIEFQLWRPRHPEPLALSESIRLVVLGPDQAGKATDWAEAELGPKEMVVYCEPRGVGATRWTRRNPPNYVERSHALLGRTVDTGRIWDVAAAARYLSELPRDGNSDKPRRVVVAGKGPGAVVAGYAALVCDEISEARLVAPPTSHMEPGSPQLLNVLRVADVPDLLGLIAPRPLTVIGAQAGTLDRTAEIYQAAGARERFQQRPIEGDGAPR